MSPVASRKTKQKSPSSRAVVRIAAPLERPWDLNEEQVTILKNSVCKGATNEELKYCLTVARRYRLDPFKQQIWFVPRNDKNADNPAGGKGMRIWTPTVGINGLLFAAARDHKNDFGSVSLPEYGPMQVVPYTYKYNNKMYEKKINAPAWAKVAVWKKGVESPTVAIAYWEEYCPEYLDSAPFWRKMPRRMLGKCATALAIRQAYPDLGGIFIPEESDRIGEDYTPEGRQITRGTPTNGSHEAAQAVAARKIAEAGHTSIEGEIVQEIAQEGQGKESLGTVEIDHTEEASPIVRGDIGNLLELIQKHCTAKWEGDWWHIKPKDAETIRQMCSQLGYKLVETMPKASAPEISSAGADKGSGSAGPTEPLVMAGTIEQVNAQSGKKPRLDVLLKVDKVKHWLSVWDSALFPAITKGKGNVAELQVVKRNVGEKVYTNVVGYLRIGAQRYESDGRTPYVSVDREPGNLFQS